MANLKTEPVRMHLKPEREEDKEFNNKVRRVDARIKDLKSN